VSPEDGTGPSGAPGPGTDEAKRRAAPIVDEPRRREPGSERRSRGHPARVRRGTCRASAAPGQTCGQREATAPQDAEENHDVTGARLLPPHLNVDMTSRRSFPLLLFLNTLDPGRQCHRSPEIRARRRSHRVKQCYFVATRRV